MTTVLAGRFRLLDAIGEGGSGTVWRAWDRRLRRVVAVKVLAASARPPRLPSGRPHLLTPYARVADGDTFLLAMELVRGGTADQLLDEHGALPEDYVAVLLHQLLQALASLHAARLVHRDVKPANLMLEPTGAGRPYLWLGDVDLAVPPGTIEARPDGAVGTPGYVAPECLAGTRPDPRQDLYAAGVTAAELLTGHRPRRARDLPRGRLRPLLAALADPDPEERPASAGAASAMLGSTRLPPRTPWRARPHPPVVPDRWRQRAMRLSRGFGC